MRFLKFASLVLGASLASAPIAAKELVYGSWQSAKGTVNTVALPWYFDEVKKATGGEISWKLVPGRQLTGPKDAVENVKNRLIDGSVPLPAYAPSVLPVTNVIFSTILPGDDLIAAVGAMAETILLNCPECTEEYKKNNAVLNAVYNIPAYEIMCRVPVTRVEDMKGKRVRVSGSGVNTIKATGAAPVAMSVVEATSALERGVIDCVHGPFIWLNDYGYGEVATHLVHAPMGMAGPVLVGYFNRDAWNEMTPAQRKVHMDHAAGLTARAVVDGQIKVNDEQLAKAREKGLVVTENSKEWEDVLASVVNNQKAAILAKAEERGVKGAERIYENYLAMYEKWKKLSQNEIKGDRDKYADVLNREIYSKISAEDL